MCGICGIVRFDNAPVLESSIRNMMQIIKHRGPDDEGVFIDNNVGLGFVRLSILDLSPSGNQPMYSSDERYAIVFNGEIFNYIELREELLEAGFVFKTQTDTEVLLSAYIHWGENCLHRFNGMWALVIYDRFEKKIFASRDRYGIKPFYYYQCEDFFAFSSEISPLLFLLPGKPKPDNKTIFDFLVFNRTDHTEDTFFEGIRKLQHGCNLTIDNKTLKLSIKKWYDLKESVSENSGFKSSQEFRELFNSAISIRLRSDVPVGVCLSGGLDSSSIVSVLLKDFGKNNLSTFSAVYSKGQTGDETGFINEYKPLVKNMFFTTPGSDSLENDLMLFVRVHEEPITDTSPYAQFKVMELAKGNVVVTLDGQGADEEMAGYHYFFGFFFKDLFRQMRLGTLLKEMIHYVKNHKNLFGIKSFFYFMLPEKLRTSTRIKEHGYINPEFINLYKEKNSIAGNLYGSNSLKNALLDHFEYKLEHLLKWEDRNSMWFSLEARVPYLDYRIVEKILATDSNLIINKGVTKHILRESMKGILPEKIRLRKDKIGFETPEAEWFRTEVWQKIITGILTSKSFSDRNLIDPVIAMGQYKKHLSGSVNISKEIWKWIHLELWFRSFID